MKYNIKGWQFQAASVALSAQYEYLHKDKFFYNTCLRYPF